MVGSIHRLWVVQGGLAGFGAAPRGLAVFVAVVLMCCCSRSFGRLRVREETPFLLCHFILRQGGIRHAVDFAQIFFIVQCDFRVRRIH